MSGCGSNDCCAANTASSALHIAIIGSGSAAFACAIAAAERGARVTLIESAEVIGGCCVNVGCVPSKAMIQAARLAQWQRHNPFEGLADHPPQIDHGLLTRQRQRLVDSLRAVKYEQILADNPALSLVRGRASFLEPGVLQVRASDGTAQRIEADRVLIATGSRPAIPAIPGLRDTPFWTSTDALFSQICPRHLLVIGSSVVAVELAQAWRRLGAAVTVLARHRLLYREDPALGEGLRQVFEEEGIEVIEQAGVSAVSWQDERFRLSTRMGVVEGDRLLVAAGRRANTDDLALDAVGIATRADGAIPVDDRLQTSTPNIYAAGDCADLPKYVYVAAAAGTRAGIHMTGGEAHLDLTVLPAVIFTDPQVATVGLDERQAQAQGIETDSRQLALAHVPRAQANGDTRGFIKLVAEAGSGRLLGAQVLASEGGEIIQSAALALTNGMTVEAMANALYPYLTMVEGLKLCAQTFSRDVSQLSCCAG